MIIRLMQVGSSIHKFTRTGCRYFHAIGFGYDINRQPAQTCDFWTLEAFVVLAELKMSNTQRHPSLHKVQFCACFAKVATSSVIRSPTLISRCLNNYPLICCSCLSTNSLTFSADVQHPPTHAQAHPHNYMHIYTLHAHLPI